MEKIVYHCDKCKSPTDKYRLAFVVGRSADGAGGMEDDVQYADLCPKCMYGELQSTIASLEYDEARRYRNRLTGE